MAYKNERRGQNKGIVFVGMGFEMVGLVIGSLWIGGVIDREFGLQGIASAGLIILALSGWIYHVVVLLQRMTQGGGSEKNK